MNEFVFKPTGVCAQSITVVLSADGNRIKSVAFEGGCDGNLKVLSKLVANQPVEQIVGLLEGNTCKHLPTSCADQMCKALTSAQMALK